MPKTARRKKRRPAKPQPARTTQRSVVPAAEKNAQPVLTEESLRNLKNLFPLILHFYRVNGYIHLVALVILAVGLITTTQSFRDTHSHSEFVTSLVMSLWVFLVFVGMLLLVIFRRKHPLSLPEQWLRRFFKWERVVMASQVAVATFLLIYRVGGVDLIADFVRTHWESVSNKAANLTSTIISLMLSGIIGNFAYDILKRFVLRRKK